MFKRPSSQSIHPLVETHAEKKGVITEVGGRRFERVTQESRQDIKRGPHLQSKDSHTRPSSDSRANKQNTSRCNMLLKK